MYPIDCWCLGLPHYIWDDQYYIRTIKHWRESFGKFLLATESHFHISASLSYLWLFTLSITTGDFRNESKSIKYYTADWNKSNKIKRSFIQPSAPYLLRISNQKIVHIFLCAYYSIPEFGFIVDFFIACLFCQLEGFFELLSSFLEIFLGAIDKAQFYGSFHFCLGVIDFLCKFQVFFHQYLLCMIWDWSMIIIDAFASGFNSNNITFLSFIPLS